MPVVRDKTAIAVLYYNKAALTRTCLQSIRDSDYAADRVFCFDNGSLTENHARVQAAFPEFHHRRIVENRGYSGGFNRALTWVFASGFSSALFLTNDTTVLPGTVEACRQAGRFLGASMIAPVIRHASHPDSIDSFGGYFDSEAATLHHYRCRDLPDLLGPGDYIPGTALWIEATAFSRLNGADERFHTYWEDADLSFRARQAGFRMGRAPDARVFHGIGRTCHKKPIYTTWYFQRNRIRFCRRHLDADALSQVLARIREELAALEIVWRKNGDQRRLGYLEKLYREIDESGILPA